MNFIEAITALKDGLCEGVRRSGKTRMLKGNLHWDETGNDDEWDCTIPGIESIIADDWELINPKPQMETITIKQWAKFSVKTGGLLCIGDEDNKPQSADSANFPVVEGTFTYERPVKAKVKRREVVGTFQGYGGHAMRSDIPKNAKLIAEWQE
jgi:hypothetical protein